MGLEADPAPAAPLRTGLFCGTFDPPHAGHVSVASDVANALELDRLLWIPAGQAPHKPSAPAASAAARLEMVQAAVTGDSRFEICDLELVRDGPSFTIDTVRELRATNPDDAFFLIIGADLYGDFASWRSPDELLGLVELVVVDRGGVGGESISPETPGADQVRFVPVRRIDISATQVRDAILAGLDIDGLVAESVAEVIARRGLYQPNE